MLANVLPLIQPLTHLVGSKGHIYFSESSNVACQIDGNEAENTMQENILPFYTPTTLRAVKRSKQFTF